MLRKGFVEQQIDALGLVLARLLKLKQNEDDEAAFLTELRKGCKGLTGLDIDAVAAMPEPVLLMLLGGGSVRDLLQTGKCVTVALLLRERAGAFRLEQREDAARGAERRAFLLLTEALIADSYLRQKPDFRTAVEELALGLQSEFNPTGWRRLFRYHAANGEFVRAMEDLQKARDAGGYPGQRDEAAAFYARLVALPEAELAAGGVTRAQAQTSLAEVRG